MGKKERQGWYWTAVIVVIWVAVIAFISHRHQQPAALKKAPVVVSADGMSLSTSEDPAKVFQKAFWRHPATDDRILHAERREWSSSEDGVRKWQWFIAVAPGAATREWLNSNPFQLAPVSAATMTQGFGKAPQWFPSKSAITGSLQKPGGGFTLGYSADGKILYATDSGFGFESAQAEAGHR